MTTFIVSATFAFDAESWEQAQEMHDLYIDASERSGVRFLSSQMTEDDSDPKSKLPREALDA